MWAQLFSWTTLKTKETNASLKLSTYREHFFHIVLRSLFVWIKVDLAAAAAAAAAFDSTFSALCGSKFASESASKHGNDCHKKNQENLIYYSRPRSEKNRESEKGLRKKEPIKLELCQWRALLSIFKANTWSTVDKVLGEVLKYRLCA